MNLAERMRLLERALKLAADGYHVFPARDKRPIVRWTQENSTDPDVVRNQPWDDANMVGIACGPSGIVVVDLDIYYEEMDDREPVIEYELLDRLEQEVAPKGWSAAGTEACVTPSGGMHLFYRADPQNPISSGTHVLKHHVDIRSVGGIIIAYDDPGPVSELTQVPAWIVEAAGKVKDAATPMAAPMEPRYRSSEDGTAYGLRALKSEIEAIRDKWEKDDSTFNDSLNVYCFSVGQLAAGGELEPNNAYQELSALLTELGASDQFKTLDSGFWSGYAFPRNSGVDSKEADASIAPEAVAAAMEEWLPPDALRKLPPPSWLFDGWVETDSIVHLVGAAGQGKTFVALDMACCAATGRSWPDRKEAARMPGNVMYIAAEGVAGFTLRVTAWEAEFGPAPLFKTLPRDVQILRKNNQDLLVTTDWRMAIEVAKALRPVLVFVDTQARCTVGVKENDNTEMGVVVHEVEKLRKATGTTVVIVHHTGKDQEGGGTARGASSWLGAVSTEIKVSQHKDTGRIMVINSKQKNAESAPKLAFMLKPVEGTESCVLVPTNVGPLKTVEEKTAMSMYRREILRVLGESKEPLRAGPIMAATSLRSRGTLDSTLKRMLQDGTVTAADDPKGRLFSLTGDGAS